LISVASKSNCSITRQWFALLTIRPFSQPDAGVQGRSLIRHWSEDNGRRIDQIVATHLLEPAIVSPILADKDRVHRGLRSTIVLEPMANKVSLS